MLAIVHVIDMAKLLAKMDNVKRRRGDNNLKNAMNLTKCALISQPWGRIMYSRTFWNTLFVPMVVI